MSHLCADNYVLSEDYRTIYFLVPFCIVTLFVGFAFALYFAVKNVAANAGWSTAFVAMLVFLIGVWMTYSYFHYRPYNHLKFVIEANTVRNVCTAGSNQVDLDKPHMEYSVQIPFQYRSVSVPTGYRIYANSELNTDRLINDGGIKAIKRLFDAGAVLIPEDAN